jgi:hypothetical protein
MVQDPLVCAHMQEKASSQGNHPDVIAQVDVMDAGNKQKLLEKRLIYYQQDKKTVL